MSKIDLFDESYIFCASDFIDGNARNKLSTSATISLVKQMKIICLFFLAGHKIIDFKKSRNPIDLHQPQ